MTIKLTRPRTIKPCGLKSSLVAVRKNFHRARRVKFWWRWGEHSRLRLPWSLTRPRTIKSCGLKFSLVAVRKIFHRARRVKFWWRWGEHSRLRLPWSLTRPRTIKSCGLKFSLVAVRKIFHRARRVKFWWRWGESNSLPTRIGETFYKFSQSFEVADSVGTANKAHRRHVAESVNAPRQERKEVRRLR